MRPAVGLLLFYKEKNEENTANIYGPREFTPNEVLTACGNWGANGLNTWALPSECNGKMIQSNNRSFKNKPLSNIQQAQFSIGWRFCPVCGNKLFIHMGKHL